MMDGEVKLSNAGQNIFYLPRKIWDTPYRLPALKTQLSFLPSLRTTTPF